jgi:hypothetical protein
MIFFLCIYFHACKRISVGQIRDGGGFAVSHEGNISVVASASVIM